MVSPAVSVVFPFWKLTSPGSYQYHSVVPSGFCISKEVSFTVRMVPVMSVGVPCGTVPPLSASLFSEEPVPVPSVLLSEGLPVVFPGGVSPVLPSEGLSVVLPEGVCFTRIAIGRTVGGASGRRFARIAVGRTAAAVFQKRFSGAFVAVA